MTHIFKGDFSKLENEERKKILPIDEIIKQLEIKKGDTVIDFGCGIGYFSIPLSKSVGDNGTVIAIDISDVMIQELKRRTKEKTNIQIINSDKLPGVPADLILIVNVLHEIDNPEKFLNKCFKILKSGGKITIIDWQKKEISIGPPLEHRLSKEEVINMLNKKFVEHKIHEYFYFIEFQK